MPTGTIDVYARWSKYDGAYPTTPEDFIRKTHVYLVTIPPSAPLAVGKRVRVLAMSPARWCCPDADVDLLEAYDAHVVGRISKVLGWRGDWVALEVENECRVSAVRKARLEIPYLPGVTVLRLDNLREGKGPKEAQMEDLDLDMRAKPPPPLWACKAGGGSIYANEGKRRRRKVKEPIVTGKRCQIRTVIISGHTPTAAPAYEPTPSQEPSPQPPASGPVVRSDSCSVLDGIWRKWYSIDLKAGNHCDSTAATPPTSSFVITDGPTPKRISGQNSGCVRRVSPGLSAAGVGSNILGGLRASSALTFRPSMSSRAASPESVTLGAEDVSYDRQSEQRGRRTGGSMGTGGSFVDPPKRTSREGTVRYFGDSLEEFLASNNHGETVQLRIPRQGIWKETTVDNLGTASKSNSEARNAVIIERGRIRWKTPCCRFCNWSSCGAGSVKVIEVVLQMTQVMAQKDTHRFHSGSHDVVLDERAKVWEAPRYKNTFKLEPRSRSEKERRPTD
ncbi:hypothetical protein K466DRAFT_566056 [Polyporus arcularius HHB13444]|uniref:Uncharacterized protein n=1 Tax=Polyporus arcularius HHB13444 TaxID=1314778 RepID=A0A5C3PBI0_9APHY|nr:hypothetical protein K466DRAFT_566056 [Polyporus arcularius HHB13444]